MLGKHEPLFELREYRVNICEPAVAGANSSATIRLAVDGEETETTANGDGPVNALDKALRHALERFFPAIADIKLTDYKVRVLDSDQASAAKVRVLVETRDALESWTTIGVSVDVIDASWRALSDAIEYKLVRDQWRAAA